MFQNFFITRFECVSDTCINNICIAEDYTGTADFMYIM